MKDLGPEIEHLSKCPTCSKEYIGDQMILLAEENQQSAFHMTCRVCRTATLVIVSSGQHGSVSLGVITDLRKEEIGKYKNEAISADDVMSIYSQVKNYKGSISNLLSFF